MTHQLKLAVFDLDGTLNQTHLYSVAAGRKALQDMGQDPNSYTDEQLIACLGKRGPDYTRELIPGISEEDIAKYLALELKWEKHFIALNADCFDGIRESLNTLKDAGWKIGVCSNSKFSYIDMVLEALDIAKLIDYKQELVDGMTKVGTLGLLLDRVKPTNAIMVGDRIYDHEAAIGNHIPFVGCVYSYTPHEVQNGEAVARSGYELASIINSL